MPRVCILAEKFYEEMELWYPYYRLQEAGCAVDLVGSTAGAVYEGKHGYPVKSDKDSASVKASDYDLVLIPGGYSPDHMRRCPATLSLVREAARLNKPLAAICHGGWMLASCADLKGRRLTSYSSIKDDLVNAGALWVDQDVVVDGNLITSRTPQDLVPFTRALLAALGLK
ncbi:MAG TPA: type 1 glutamine amidotransferase domain-containing protein [bacterium]|jgi:protease I|nr:type 1 glutamine amidotransferase domain-containing protein [bacterium]